MNIEWSGDKDSQEMSVSGPALISSVAELKKALMQCLETGGMVAVNLKDVDDCDTAGVQTLLAFQREAASRDSDISLIEVSSAVFEAADRAALTFDDWSPTGEEVYVA